MMMIKKMNKNKNKFNKRNLLKKMIGKTKAKKVRKRVEKIKEKEIIKTKIIRINKATKCQLK